MKLSRLFGSDYLIESGLRPVNLHTFLMNGAIGAAQKHLNFEMYLKRCIHEYFMCGL